MSFYIKLIIVFVLVILQITIFSHLGIGNVYPNLLLCLVLLTCIYWSREDVLILAVVAGFMLDTLSGLPFGTITLSFLAVIALYYFLLKKFLSEGSPVSWLITIAAGTIVFGLLEMLFAKILGWHFQFSFWYQLLTLVLPQVIYHMVVVAVILKMIDFYRRRRQYRRGYHISI